MHWARSVSPQAKHLLLCDDDVYINTTGLLAFLAAAPSEGFYAGQVWQDIPQVPQR